MLFLVHMRVSLPPDLAGEARERLLADEKAMAQRLQREGTWVHLWREVGQYANYSVFDVASGDQLHDILWNLPLFPYMTVTVTALARHPSALP
ncbi:MAG: muconolactone Delta-isomerase [Actinomycetota bacterium]